MPREYSHLLPKLRTCDRRNALRVVFGEGAALALYLLERPFGLCVGAKAHVIVGHLGNWYARAL